MTTFFPDFSAEEFNSTEDWIVVDLNDESLIATFDGRGDNQDLSFEMDFTSNPDFYASLSIGELINLPRELFVPYEGQDICIDDVF